MISMHLMIYSDDAEATRAFFRDVLEMPHVIADDFGSDWLIFRTGPSELGVHPTRSEWEGKTYEHPRHQNWSLMTDDLDAEIARLKEKGAKFHGEVMEEIYGRVIMLEVPGVDPIQLYQPSHPTAYNLR